MKKQCNSPCDRISKLPSHISQTILMLLSLRDMVRTSILSKHWRYQWVYVPQLVFKNDPMYRVSREERYRYNAMRVLEILFQHHGPLLRLVLNMTAWLDCSAIHKIIPVMSRNRIQELTVFMPVGECYTLPSSILSCVELRHLGLCRCVFQPLTIGGFSKLVSIMLVKVELDSDVSISSCPLLESLVLHTLSTVNLLSIDAPNLKYLNLRCNLSQIGVMNTPLLKYLRFIAGDESFAGNSSFDLMSILHSLPLLKELHVSSKFLQVLAIENSPNKLSKSLNNLLTLEVGASREFSSTFWFTRSFPNLQKLKFTLHQTKLSLVEVDLYSKMQEHSNHSLLKLQVVEMVLLNPCDMKHVIEFSKILLDKSPVLGTFYIKPDSKLIDGNGLKRLIELACYPRASPKAKIVFAGLESLKT